MRAKISCDLCSSIFCEKRKLLIHVSRFHKQKHHCDYCGVELTTKQSLERHMKNADPDVCNDCGAVFCSNKALESHIFYRHKHGHDKELNSYSCDECEGSFPTEPSLKYHVRTQHSGSLLHCDLCEFSFTDMKTFNIHN